MQYMTVEERLKLRLVLRVSLCQRAIIPEIVVLVKIQCFASFVLLNRLHIWVAQGTHKFFKHTEKLFNFIVNCQP